MEKYKSPIKAKALRNPGQSVEEKIRDLIDEKMLSYILASTFVIVYAALEWTYWYLETPRSPWVLTILAGIVLLFSLYKVIKLRKVIKTYRQGLDGERAVGQYLEKLRKVGFDIYHDIVFDGFNIDHVAISTNGIFCIETKTYSKPEKGEAKIDYDGNTVVVNGYKKGSPIIQAKAASKTLQELLEQSCGKKFNVRPVLLFPGWFIESKGKDSQKEVWALNPKGFQIFAQNQGEQLTDDDAKLAAYHLSRHIRGT